MTTPAPATRLGFRPDINGLRAIAVLAVLAFHFEIAPFRSGFTGVDVFFVISGYLMTGIILGRLDKGSFSVLGFYLDRARRIVPALLVLVAAVIALGWFILLPDEYIILAKHAASSVTFLSNLYYWNEAGYFDPGVDQKWLLHTWSLSVEWQFYLLYPLLVLAIVRLAPRTWLRPILIGLALLSFANMLWLSRITPDAGFYLLPPRAWEMLVGGLVFMAPALTGRTARAAQWTGLAMILASALVFVPSQWPHVGALLPVLGTALVILAARRDSRITGNPVAAWVGLNSYSIYLWHWPVVAFIKRYGHGHDPLWIAGGLALSFLLGHLSWRFIERLARPATRAPHIHTSRIVSTIRAHAVFALPVAALVVVSGTIWKARGVPQRFSAEVQMAAQDAIPGGIVEARPCYSHLRGVPDPCVLGPGKSPVLVTLLGDSHAESAILSVVEAKPGGLAGGIAFNAYAACPPVLDIESLTPRSQCGAFNRRFLDPQTRTRTTPLILAGSWASYVENTNFRFPGTVTPGPEDFLANLYRSTCRLAAAGPTYVVLPTPEFPFWVSRELARRLVADPAAPEIAMPLSQHEARNRGIIDTLRRAGRDCGARLLDADPILCPNGQCQGSRGHRAIFRDEHHMSDYGARLLVPMYRPVFAGAAQPEGSAR